MVVLCVTFAALVGRGADHAQVHPEKHPVAVLGGRESRLVAGEFPALEVLDRYAAEVDHCRFTG